MGRAKRNPSACHMRGDDGFCFALPILRTASRPWPLPPGPGAPEPAVSSYRTKMGRHTGRTHRSGAKQLTDRSEEHTSELQSLMRISYAVFCWKKKRKQKNTNKLQHN